MEVLAGLSVADARDVLEYTAELIERAKAPLDNVRTEQSEELAESADFLTKTAMRQIELRHKRALTQATRTSLRQNDRDYPLVAARCSYGGFRHS